ADEVDDVCRVRVDLRGGDVGVPEAGGWERHKPIQAGTLAEAHPGTGSGLCHGDTARQEKSQDDGLDGSNRSHTVSFLSAAVSSGWGCVLAFPTRKRDLRAETRWRSLKLACTCRSTRSSKRYLPSSTSLIRPNFSGTWNVLLMVGCHVMP